MTQENWKESNMKLRVGILAVTLLAIVSSIVARALEEGESAMPERYPEIPAITLPTSEAYEADRIATASGTVEFPGGRILGHVKKTNKDGVNRIIIDGDVGILLTKDNTGGVLRIDFSSEQIETVKALFSDFPDSFHPQAVDLDGRPVEIEIKHGANYLHISLSEGIKIVVEKIVFLDNARLEHADNFNGIQLVIRPKFLPMGEELEYFFNKVKPLIE